MTLQKKSCQKTQHPFAPSRCVHILLSIMPKKRAPSSHQNHGRSRAFRKERFPQVTKHFRSRKPVRTDTAAQLADSDSDDDFVPPTEAQFKLRQKRAAAITLIIGVCPQTIKRIISQCQPTSHLMHAQGTS